MTPARFGVQALFVLTLVMLVSWPEQGELRAGSFWHGRTASAARSGDAADARSGFRGQRALIGYGSARAPFGPDSNALNRKLYENDVEGRRRTPDGVLALGGRVNAILGYARSAGNTPMPFARLLLRNVVTGMVEARSIADEKGRFTFLDIIPSGYIVEMMDANGVIIATSELIEIANADLRETIVRASGRQTLAALFGGALTPTAHETVAAAANQGVNQRVAAERCASPPCN